MGGKIQLWDLINDSKLHSMDAIFLMLVFIEQVCNLHTEKFG